MRYISYIRDVWNFIKINYFVRNRKCDEFFEDIK